MCVSGIARPQGVRLRRLIIRLLGVTTIGLLLQACSSTQLHLWHTEKLKEEFTAREHGTGGKL